MKNKKAIVLSVIAVITLLALIIGATYAYFQASGGSGTSANLRVTTYTTDVFNFEIGDDISIYADQTSFGSGKGNALGTTFAKAILTANNKTNTTTEHYNLYLNISDNNFKYAIGTSSPDLLLTIKDGNNNEITSISGLEHKTVTDAKGVQISGFDITTKTGLLTLLDNREITASPTKTDTWNITVTLINYDNDQSVNMGKTFSGQILIGKDNYDSYTPNTINTLSATRSGSNLTVKLNVEQGSNEIDKYYFAIKEKDTLAINDSKSKIQRLSNVIAANETTYVESSSNSYTFNNIKNNSSYEISAYAIDKKKVKTNVYNYNYRTDNYNLPVISKVETSKTTNTITTTVTASQGTNNISKYYYSIDNGNTYKESTSNTYTFTNLKSGNYRIIVKVIDTNGIYSNIYVVNEKIISSSSNLIRFTYAGTEYSAEKGMTFAQWAESEYNTFGYFIEEDTLIEKNNSYENFNNRGIAKTDKDYCGDVGCLIYQTEGTFIESLSETNLKTIYKKDNYNDIGKTYGYLEKIQTYNFDELYAYANGLNASQQTFLQNFIDSNLVPMPPTIFVNIDTTVLSPDSNGYYTIPITAEVLKELNIDCVKLLMFDGITDNFSNPQIEDYDNAHGIITLKAKGNFAIAFFQSEE